MRNFLFLALFGMLVFSFSAVADNTVADNTIEDLQEQIRILLQQIKALEENKTRVSLLSEVPVFEHVAVGWDQEHRPAGNFVYFRPIIWESFQNGIPNVHGRYDHKQELLNLSDEVEAVLVLMDDRIISIRGSVGVRSDSTNDPVQSILNDSALYAELHQDETELSGRNVRSTGSEYSSHGLYPISGHDLLVRVGDTIVGVKFPKRDRIEYHRQVRIIVVGGGKVSFHGYPEFSAPQNLNYAEIAGTSTNALGLFLVSEMVRDITLLLHEIRQRSFGDGAMGAPSLHEDSFSVSVKDVAFSVEDLGIRTDALGLSVISPEGKRFTTWGSIKSR